LYWAVKNPTREGLEMLTPTQVLLQEEEEEVVVGEVAAVGGISPAHTNRGTRSKATEALKLEKGKVGVPVGGFGSSVSYVIIS